MHGYLNTNTNTNININAYSNAKSYSHTATSPKSAASPDALLIVRIRLDGCDLRTPWRPHRSAPRR